MITPINSHTGGLSFKQTKDELRTAELPDIYYINFLYWCDNPIFTLAAFTLYLVIYPFKALAIFSL